MEDYKTLYEQRLERAKEEIKKCGDNKGMIRMIENIFPELKESEDEAMIKSLKRLIKAYYDVNFPTPEGFERKDMISWLEKQAEQKLVMIQWQGNNLKEVIDFTGKNKNFEKWFKSFEEYEKYVDDHNGIFKLFNEDGSHYEVPVGAWIVKTPDGHNVASKAIFRQKTAWSEEDESNLNEAIYYIRREPYREHDVEPIVDWLKSLKERIKYETT